jgi:putative transposase
MVSKQWRVRWAEAVLFLKFPPEIRMGVYTTNAIESLNYSIQEFIRHRQSFPSDEVALKLRKWTMPFKNWGAALNQFAVIYGGESPVEKTELHKKCYKP